MGNGQVNRQSHVSNLAVSNSSSSNFVSHPSIYQYKSLTSQRVTEKDEQIANMRYLQEQLTCSKVTLEDGQTVTKSGHIEISELDSPHEGFDDDEQDIQEQKLTTQPVRYQLDF